MTPVEQAQQALNEALAAQEQILACHQVRQQPGRDGLSRAAREVKAAREHLRAAQIEQARQAERDRPKLTRADMLGARAVRTRWGWSRILRVNTATVTTSDLSGDIKRIGFDRILEVRQ